MQSSFSIATPIPTESIVINKSPSPRPTTLLLRTNRPYFYNSWTYNNRLRLENEKLSKRQQSSCRIAFYSLWLCVSASIMIIVIYRFTDECSLVTNPKQFFIKCLRHWLFFTAISVSLLAGSGVVFGAYRYFHSKTFNIIYDDKYQLHSANTNDLLPTSTSSYRYSYPTSLTNVTSNTLFRSSQHHDRECPSTTTMSPSPNISPRHKIPPFNYDELPHKLNTLSTSDKSLLFPSSTSSFLQPIFPSTRTSNVTNTTINSNISQATSTFQDTCPGTSTSHPTCLCRINVWEKQQRSP